MSDYLYDKEGEDPDVEKLERSLGGLKYDQAAPELPGSAPRQPREPDYSQAPIDAYRPRAGWLGARVPLAIAAGVALIGGIAATLALKPQVNEGGNLVPVVVAAVDLNPGTVVTFDQLSLRVLPEKFVEPRALRPEQVVFILNHPIHALVRAGDPLLSGQLDSSAPPARDAKKSGLTLSVATGQGASVSALLPDELVDLVGTFTDPSSHASVAVTLLQNVSVDAVPPAPNQVALKVLPEEAQLLKLATRLQGLELGLRRRNEGGPARKTDTISILRSPGD